ncbi:MAG: CDP-glycerol glycerophosphotransferase family protein [Clostridiales bacterium]|nr:CDP-glycerol glycerophosphotransferase family protein [Clostridiales bacterium]
MYKIKRIFIYIRVFLIMTVAEFVGLFVRRSKTYKDLWIIAERGVDARDNSYHFFKFLTKEHPEINAVYIITKDSPDRSKVAPLGKLVNYGSFKHYLCFILAKVRVSTHIDGYSPDILFFNKFGKLFPSKAKKIFLQHGIIKDDLLFCHADNTNIDMFVCSAVPEYEYIDKVYGYKEGILQLTGLCRFDNLKKTDALTHKLLFMPTWRSNLRTCNRHTFLESDYYKKYNSFLNSEKLSALLKEYDYELIFYPHHEVQRFIDCFKSDDPAVSIADFSNSDVQSLLINSDVLITDYSSVFFDYGYMRKPMVFYQYDEASFRAIQYKEGYFDYRRDGFGAVVETEDEAIDSLRHIFENDMQPDGEYLEKMNAFFIFNDANNCRRVYDAICRLL